MAEVLKKDYIFTRRDLLELMAPLVVEQFLAVGVVVANSVMVASVGESAVSAVSLVDSINILLINVFAALATGGAVVAGRYLGQNKNEEACRAGEQLMVFVTFIAVVIMVLMFLGRGFILNVVFGSIEADVADYADRYMRIIFASIPFVAIYNSSAALFRSMGNSRITMTVSFVMSVANVLGNALLVYGFNMEVEGVAIPELLSRAAAAAVIVRLLKNESLPVHIGRLSKYKYNKNTVADMLSIGVPNSVENSMFQLGKIMLLSLVAEFGTHSITANAIGNTVASFEVIPGVAIGLGLIAVVSQCVGAGDYEQVRYYTRKLIKYAYIILIFLNVSIVVALPYLLKIYNLSAETYSMAVQVIVFHSVNACLTWVPAFVLPNTLRAASDARYTMIVGVLSMWTIRIGFGIVLAKYMNFGMLGVWVAMFIDWIIRSIFFTARYRGHRWENR